MAKAEVPEHYTVSGIIGAPTINNRHVLVSLRQKEFTGWVLGGPKACLGFSVRCYLSL